MVRACYTLPCCRPVPARASHLTLTRHSVHSASDVRQCSSIHERRLREHADCWRILERVARVTYESDASHEDARVFPTLADYEGRLVGRPSARPTRQGTESLETSYAQENARGPNRKGGRCVRVRRARHSGTRSRLGTRQGGGLRDLPQRFDCQGRRDADPVPAYPGTRSRRRDRCARRRRRQLERGPARRHRLARGLLQQMRALPPRSVLRVRHGPGYRHHVGRRLRRVHGRELDGSGADSG